MTKDEITNAEPSNLIERREMLEKIIVSFGEMLDETVTLLDGDAVIANGMVFGKTFVECSVEDGKIYLVKNIDRARIVCEVVVAVRENKYGNLYFARRK